MIKISVLEWASHLRMLAAPLGPTPPGHSRPWYQQKLKGKYSHGTFGDRAFAADNTEQRLTDSVKHPCGNSLLLMML